MFKVSFKNFAHITHPHIVVGQVAVKREEAVTREVSKKLAEDKKMSKKEKDER